MKLRILSDLHLDHRRDPEGWLHSLPEVECDAVILAGDVAEARTLARHLLMIDKWAGGLPVLFVPGNHDYWGGPEIARTAMEYAEFVSRGRIDCLDRGTSLLDHPAERDELPLSIAGATGWTKGEPIPADRHIYGPYTEEWMQQECEDDYEFLLSRVDQEVDVIVTHHLPHPRSCDRRYDSHKGWLAEHLSYLVGTTKLWVHGHTHTACQYTEGKTLVVCNPAGYPGENTGWDPALVIDTEEL